MNVKGLKIFAKKYEEFYKNGVITIGACYNKKGLYVLLETDVFLRLSNNKYTYKKREVGDYKHELFFIYEDVKFKTILNDKEFKEVENV